MREMGKLVLTFICLTVNIIVFKSILKATVYKFTEHKKEVALDTLNTERRSHLRKDCNGIVLFNVLSENLNFTYCNNSKCIKGIAQAINMNESGMMMRMIDMLGLSDNLKGFSFSKFKGTSIVFGKPDDGKIIRAEVMHVTNNSIGVRYL
jgi:hypothetical protein